MCLLYLFYFQFCIGIFNNSLFFLLESNFAFYAIVVVALIYLLVFPLSLYLSHSLTHTLFRFVDIDVQPVKGFEFPDSYEVALQCIPYNVILNLFLLV